MCGILGTIDVPLTKKNLDLIRHRGPDEQGMKDFRISNGRQVYFGHTRLSILDLSAAASQPMVSDCGNYAIVFNGEIYNHLELRKKLPGMVFNSHSDTATILYYIKKFGIDSVSDFNGIFAFSFLDIQKCKLYVVRDHYGVKPLYYAFDENKFLFSSELKTILSTGVISNALSWDAIDTFLSLKFNPAPQTLFEKIKKLAAGSYLEISILDQNLVVTSVQYTEKNTAMNHATSMDEAITTYQKYLEEAVERQLLSDVPVGLFLSGGVDSAVIGYLMRPHCSYKIKTFTVGFDGIGDFNEMPDAKKSADFIGSEHYELVISRNEYMDFFEKSFFYTEEPIAEPTIPALYYVSKLASSQVKVVLSGQGADEPLAGYKRYLGEKLLTRYGWFLNNKPSKLILERFRGKESINRFTQSLDYLKDDLERMLSVASIFTGEQKKQLYKQDINVEINTAARSLIRQKFNEAGTAMDSLNRLLYVDVRTLLADNLLIFNDKLTMANSIEQRVPFLDTKLVGYIESLPSHFKLHGTTGKYVHKKAVKKYLPDEIIYRKKRGFATPVNEWLQQDNMKLLDYLFDADSFCNTHFNRPFIESLIRDHKNKKKNNSKHLFALISLELWHRYFFKQNRF